jgi:LytS/YehU family sensor histidine kinase
MAFAAMSAIIHGVEYHRRFRERERQARRLERELMTAQLDALRAQLQPHFLFNWWRTRSSTGSRGSRAPASCASRRRARRTGGSGSP